MGFKGPGSEPSRGGTADAEIKVNSVEDPQLLKVLSVRPRVMSDRSLHALSAAGNSAFPICVCPVHSTVLCVFFSELFFKHKETL